MSTKGLTKDLINGYKILNGAKYLFSVIFQNYLVFIPAKKYIKHFSGTSRINSSKSNGMLEENIELNQTEILHQLLFIIVYYQT